MIENADPSALPDPELDPYAPPSEAIGEGATLEGSEDLVRAEAIRRRHLNHEASVKSIGHLHYLGVILFIFGAAGVLVQRYRMGPPEAGPEAVPLVFLIVYFAVVISLNLVMGVGLTGLKTWARWVEVVLTILSLLYCILAAVVFALHGGPAAIGVGPPLFFMAIFGIYILYLLLSKKGSMVFSPEYREIIQVTPHVKYRTSWIVKGCLIAFVLLIVFATLVALFAPRR
jgi:hypothetical protein